VTLEASAIDNRYSITNIKTKSSADCAELNVSVIVSDDISRVKSEWRSLEKHGLESPGQSYEFIRLWIDSFSVAKKDQSFFVVKLDNKPIIGMAFELDSHMGVKVLVPYGAYHVGSGAPLVDSKAMASLSSSQRKELWLALRNSFKGVDIAFFRFVPQYTTNKDNDLFSQIGVSVPADQLYRAEFDSWESCDKEQRTRTRRKHDKQHSIKLNAFGDVAFEEMSAKSPKAREIIEIMFAQRAKRFAVQGIEDPFVEQDRKEFYHKAGALEGDLSGVLHILRLNGEIIAIRYNLVHQGRMFCLISSMSENVKIQKGAPGKQCLLRVMQTVFDNGINMFDMGAGLTDEKRHWCNKTVSLVHYYMPLTLLGYVVMSGHRLKKYLRYKIKNNSNMIVFVKKIRKLIHRGK